MTSTPKDIHETLDLAAEDTDFASSDTALNRQQIYEFASRAMLDLGFVGSLTSAELATLTFEISKLQLHSISYREAWGPQLQRLRQFAKSLVTLEEVIPPMREEFSSAKLAVEIDGALDAAHTFAGNLKVLDDLLASATKARDMFTRTIMMEWEQIARPIDNLFHEAFDAKNLPGGAAKAAGYRFTALVVSAIMGEDVTDSMVEALLKKKRDVNRGRNFFDLPQGKTR
jgi:hypothetical protein